VSKTERALTSSETEDALDELFDDESFDSALDDPREEADREFDIAADGTDATDEESDDVDDAVAEEVIVDDDDAVDDAELDDEQIVESEVADSEADSDSDLPVDVDDAVVDDLHEDVEQDSDEQDSVEQDGEEDVDDVDAELEVDDELDSDVDVVEEGDDADVEAQEHVESDEHVEDDGPPTAEFPAPIAEIDDDDDDDALPTIVQAIPDDDDLVGRSAPSDDPDVDIDVDDDEVSDQILEELRRADIDGPVVAFAPQDDTTAARRRPKQAADYDPAPVPIPAKVPRVLGRKARVRKVTRVVRHVDPWSVFKIAIVAFFVGYIIVLTASVLLWNVAYATGTIDNIERFFESFGWNSFEFNGGELYHAGWIAGLFAVIGLTGLAVLTATLFNLITDLVGGVRFTVLEEEVVENRTSPMRRFVVRRTEPEVPAVIRDASGAMYREAVVDDTGANARPTR
jgi:hypothetical protein